MCVCARGGVRGGGGWGALRGRPRYGKQMHVHDSALASTPPPPPQETLSC